MTSKPETEIFAIMRSSLRFSIGLSLTVFIVTLAVVSFLTPAHQKLASKINGPTLKAAATMKAHSSMPTRTH